MARAVPWLRVYWWVPLSILGAVVIGVWALPEAESEPPPAAVGEQASAEPASLETTTVVTPEGESQAVDPAAKEMSVDGRPAVQAPEPPEPEPPIVEPPGGQPTPVEPFAGERFVAVEDFTPRRHHTATVLLDGRVLLAGGAGSRELHEAADLYEPDAGWIRAGGAHFRPRQTHTSTLLLDGRVLLAGGVWEGGELVLTSEIFDPSMGLLNPTMGGFVEAARLNVARVAHAAALLPDGRVLVVGGVSVGDPLWGSVEIYDPAADRFELAGMLPEGMGGGVESVVLDDRRVFVVSAGRASVFDPASGAFVELNGASGIQFVGFSETEPRWPSVPTRLQDGTILLTGDCCEEEGVGRSLPSAAILDPVSGVLTALPAMNVGRVLHAATLLCDGQALITGGIVVGNEAEFEATAAAEIYDPETRAFRAIEPMAAARQRHTSTLLPDGSVLIVGFFFSDPELPAAEVYLPTGECR